MGMEASASGHERRVTLSVNEPPGASDSEKEDEFIFGLSRASRVDVGRGR